jgi:hypothetical protein
MVSIDANRSGVDYRTGRPRSDPDRPQTREG